jgi:hypothetical protein
MQQLRLAGCALAALLALSVSAAAQVYSGAPTDPRQHGYEHGYRDGYERGRLDRDQNLPANARLPEAAFINQQYQPYMGRHEDFVLGYGDGYRTGYEDGYNHQTTRWNQVYQIQPNYNPATPYPENQADRVYEEQHWGYQDVAYDVGYRDGLSMGQYDFSRHREFRPQKNDRYEDADHGYAKSYGDKSTYKARYREGFLRGYEDGYGRWK